MEWLAYLVDILKTMLMQAQNLYAWILTPIFKFDGVEYSALYITTPLVLIIILEYNIVRWLL